MSEVPLAQIAAAFRKQPHQFGQAPDGLNALIAQFLPQRGPDGVCFIALRGSARVVIHQGGRYRASPDIGQQNRARRAADSDAADSVGRIDRPAHLPAGVTDRDPPMFGVLLVPLLHARAG